jgi:ATP-dependent helicase/nuclease subunit B
MNKLLSAAGSLGEKSVVQARFLLGPAGSGKTFRCLDEIRAALKKNPDGSPAAPEQREGGPLVLLAPKQATFQLERQLLGWGAHPREPKTNSADIPSGAAPCQISGYTRLQILSFERLARFALEKLQVAPPKLLSEEGRIMVLRALLMRHEGDLKLFRRSARRSGFAQEISALLKELQQHQLPPARLHALAERADLRRELRDKLHDLALLSEKYAGWLNEHDLQDTSRLLDVATKELQKNFNLQPSAFSLSRLWLDGFAEMTPQELDLLAATIPFCENATLAFCLDERSAGGPPASRSASETPVPQSNSWLSIWNAVGKTFQQCRQRLERLPGVEIETEFLPRRPERSRFPDNSALATLETNWPRPAARPSEISNLKSQISVIACAHPKDEAVFAAREILKFVRAGNRFRDCAVLVRNLDPYHQPLARVFRRFEIPFFLDRREAVAHHPLAELTRSAVRTIAFDWRHNDWFAALKAGFAPVEENEIDRLENAALEHGWHGGKWHAPLPDEFCERVRLRIFPPFANFAAQIARFNFRPDGAQLAGALRELWSDLKVERTLERWTLDGEHSALRTRHSALHSTVWDQMNAWLENLALAFPNESLPLRDWLPVVEAGLARLTVGVIPPVLDEVLVGAIDRARNPDLKFTLVLGMNEGIFPATPAPAAILSDADRDELGGTVHLGPDLRERLARERYYGYIACTRASEKLAVTFARFDADGKALNPSPFVAHLRNLFPKLEIEEFAAGQIWRGAEHAAEIAPVLMTLQERRALSRHEGNEAEQPAGTVPGVPTADELAELLKIPALKLLADKIAELREPAADETLSPALAGKLYRATLQTSVSRLEEFAQCPFRFFIHSGLRAEERKMFELDARERGSFQHEVLKFFHEQVTAEGRRWRDLTPVEARERLGKIADGLVENFHAGLMRDTAQTRFEARTMAESLQNFIAVIVTWMRGQYEFDPAAAELDFGGESSVLPAWELDLGGGHRLALCGRIDRIDLCRDGDRTLAVVMDYKSRGKKPDALLIEHGVQLQLLAYLNVLRHSENPAIAPGVARLVPAGVFYVNLRGQFKGGSSRAEALADPDAARRLAYRHAGRFDAGALPALDCVGAADQFNYRLNQDGTLRKGSIEALPRAEFEKLLDDVELRLREMGRAIYSGEAAVDPYRKGAEIPCDFCDYRAACRIDPWTHQWRVLRAAKESGSAAVPAAS